MAIKFTRVDPVPVTLPPPTYSITGLSKQQVKWLKAAIRRGAKGLPEQSAYPPIQEEVDFLRRIDAVILTLD